MDKPGKLTQTSLGMLWMLATGLCFVAVTVLVRYVGTDLPAAESAFIRYLIGTTLLLPVIYRLLIGNLQVLSWRPMLIRGVVHGTGVILWFYAMARIPIAEVTALGYLTPILITLGAALFFGEKLHLRRIAAIFFGLVGVMIILRPGISEVSIGQIAQLLASPLFAASMLLTKRMSSTENHLVVVAVLSVICTLTLLPPALMNWVQPEPVPLFLLALTAVFATIGHFTMTRAFSLAPLTVLQPVSFLQLLWATLLGILLFKESIDIFVVAGGAILIVSTTYIAHRESVANRKARSHATGEQQQ